MGSAGAALLRLRQRLECGGQRADGRNHGGGRGRGRDGLRNGGSDQGFAREGGYEFFD